jgi:hypothetical protein
MIILKKLTRFYANLYNQSKCFKSASDELKQEFIPKESRVKLSQELQDSCEGLITKQ